MMSEAEQCLPWTAASAPVALRKWLLWEVGFAGDFTGHIVAICKLDLRRRLVGLCGTPSQLAVTGGARGTIAACCDALVLEIELLPSTGSVHLIRNGMQTRSTQWTLGIPGVISWIKAQHWVVLGHVIFITMLAWPTAIVT